MEIKIIIFILAGLILAFPAAASVQEYRINLSTEPLSVEKIDVLVKDKADFWEMNRGDHYWELKSGKDVIESSYFSIIETLFYDSVNPETGVIDSGGMIERKLDSVELNIPYYPLADKIVIYSIDNKKAEKIQVLEIDVTIFEDSVASEIIKEKEQENKSGITSEREYVEKESWTKSYFVYILIALLMMVLAAILYMAYKRKK